MRLGKRNLIATLAALALSAALPAAAAAAVAAPIRAVFLKEYSKPEFAIAQGDILVFENDDPFFTHGVFSSAFSSPVIKSLSTHLVVGAPFLRPGSYAFADPAHPEMTSSLTVTKAGAPLPPDSTPPTARTKILSKGKQVVKGGKVKLRVTPSEPVDVSIKAKVGKLVLGAATRTFAIPTPGAVTIVVDPVVRKRLSGSFTLEVKGTISDVAGNSIKLRKSARLSGGKK
jgi:hypothetical protein